MPSVLSKPEGHSDGTVHQRLKQQYADLVLSNPSGAVSAADAKRLRVAHLIRQGRRLVLALRVIKITDRMNKGGQ